MFLPLHDIVHISYCNSAFCYRTKHWLHTRLRPQVCQYEAEQVFKKLNQGSNCKISKQLKCSAIREAVYIYMYSTTLLRKMGRMLANEASVTKMCSPLVCVSATLHLSSTVPANISQWTFNPFMVTTLLYTVHNCHMQ